MDRNRGAGLLVGLAVFVLGCETAGDPTFPDVTDPAAAFPKTADAYFSSLLSNAEPAVYVDAVLPQGGPEVPEIAATVLFDPGTPFAVTLQPAATTTRLLVGVGTAERGYFEVSLPATPVMQGATTSGSSPGEKGFGSRSAVETFALELVPHAELAVDDLELVIVEGDGEHWSAPAVHHLHRRSSAPSLPLEVRLQWADPVDFDLHLILPDGSDLYWGDPNRAGGSLDADDTCAQITEFEESIRFASAPPAGTYEVRVALWGACGSEGPLPFVVTVIREGTVAHTDGIMFASEAAPDAEGAGVAVVSFDVD